MSIGCKTIALAFGAVVSVCFACHGAFADNTLIGRYCGTLESSGHLVPAETDLFRDGKGGLTGGYHFDDNGKTYEGKFLSGKLIGSGEWLLQWQDEFGLGTLDIEFNSDATLFNGQWGANRDRPSLPWNGKLCTGAATS